MFYTYFYCEICGCISFTDNEKSRCCNPSHYMYYIIYTQLDNIIRLRLLLFIYLYSYVW